MLVLTIDFIDKCRDATLSRATTTGIITSSTEDEDGIFVVNSDGYQINYEVGLGSLDFNLDTSVVESTVSNDETICEPLLSRLYKKNGDSYTRILD